MQSFDEGAIGGSVQQNKLKNDYLRINSPTALKRLILSNMKKYDMIKKVQSKSTKMKKTSVKE